MRRLLPGSRLVVATHNPGKLVEITDLVRPYGLNTVSAGALNVTEPEETETTFIGNARLKALHSARATGHPALADDSGLEVHALGGDPGVYSARWAGPDKNFAVAMTKVADALTAKDAWRAQQTAANFTCVLSLAWPDGESVEFEGKVFGRLVWPGRGDRGFGFDPMFIADGTNETYGEMNQDKKHASSHRAQAFKLFVAACLGPTA